MSTLEFVKKKFTPLFAFSIGYYIIGTMKLVSDLFQWQNPLENVALFYLNIISDIGLYSFFLITLVISFWQNYIRAKNFKSKRPWDAMCVLTVLEMFLMLGGTLASLLFFLSMAF